MEKQPQTEWQPKEPSATESASLTSRLAWTLTAVWAGNRNAMARDLGCSNSYVAKVVNGTQEAGRQLIEAIARRAPIRIEWLLTGRGPALATSGIPLATQPLTDRPPQHSTARVEGLDHLYSESRYWLPVPDRHSLLRSGGCGLRAGDLLLMESDRSAIRQMLADADHLSEWLCAAPVTDLAGTRVELVRGIYHPADVAGRAGSLELDVNVASVARTILDQYPDGSIKVEQRQLPLEEDPRSRTGTRLAESQHLMPILDVDKLHALSVLLVRRFGREPIRIEQSSPPPRPGRQSRKKKKRRK